MKSNPTILSLWVGAFPLLMIGASSLQGVAPKERPKCDQIDLENKDTDGMPFCPDVALTNTAYGVYRCALAQARSYHPPKPKEKENMRGLISAFKQSKLEGISEKTTQSIRSFADALDLQVCRIKRTITENDKPVTDSYLLAYTKKGVTDYSGPFLMLRETKSSNVIIVSPHDDSDGTFADTKNALTFSRAMITISNGHLRRQAGGKGGDFVHSKDNLGYSAVQMIGSMFPKSVWLHVHGMKIPDKVLYRARDKKLGKIYEDAIVKFTNIKSNAFGNLNAYFTIDNIVNTSYYIKTEIPARIHSANKMALSHVVREIEKYDFAWPSSTFDEDFK